MMLFLSCKTTVVEKTVYYIPGFDWPEFPELGDCETLKDGRIATDEDYFRKLLVFKTLYLDEKEKYEEKRKLLEEMQK